MPYLTSLGQNLPDDSNYSELTQLGAGIRNALASIAGVGNAMPESYGANAPIMDPLANAVISAGRTAMIPGQAYNSLTPVTTQQMVQPAADLAGMTTLGAGAMPAEADALRMGIKAYHGSPHDFDAFSLDKIGTGEGAQAYGHGLYFAGNEDVAQSYRDALSARVYSKGSYDPNNPLDVAQKALIGTTPDQAIANIQRRVEAFPDVSSGDRDAIELIRSGRVTGEPASSGHMYEVNINADPEQFLDWDKPLSEQSPQVRRQLEDVYPDLKGSTVSQAFPYGIRPQISEALNKSGIPGIKYLDQGSRPPRPLADTQESIKYYSDMLAKEPNNQFAADQLQQYQNDLAKYDKGSRNYVVFDDKLIDILKKYGLFGAAALPALGSSNNGKT